MLTKKPQPVAVCTRCGSVSYSTAQINGRCSQMTAGTRCTGVIGSAMNKTEWEECPACVGTGDVNTKRCGQCDGAGWRFIGNRKR